MRTPRPIDAAVEIVCSYQQGAFPRMEIDGTTVYSKECVIFLNSVNNILNIIKQTGLKSDEVNIIVGNSTDNDSQIKKLGADFMNGRTHTVSSLVSPDSWAGLSDWLLLNMQENDGGIVRHSK